MMNFDFKQQLDAYLHLSKQDLARLVLALLLEELLKERLSVFRTQQLIEGQ